MNWSLRSRAPTRRQGLGKAKDCCRRIVERYRRPNMTSGQLHAAFEANELDPLKEFSAAYRSELLAMSSTV